VGKTLLKTLFGPDCRQRANFFADANGTYSYGVDQFYDADPNNPYERPPGYWTPIWQSGIYASQEDTERNLAEEGGRW
jgi:hypothetical protein